MDSRQFKDLIYQEFAHVGKAISSPKRIELLDLLTQSPKTVELLSQHTGMSVANTSKHLQSLLDSKLVAFSKNKNYVIYRLASEQVREFILALRGITEERSPDVNHLREEYILRENTLDPISFEELTNGLKNKEVVLLDVRATVEFEADHLPHAISIPITELKESLTSLPKNKGIIAYCRGPYCAYATEAVEFLRSEGYEANLLEAGINEWKQSFYDQA